MKLLQIIFSLTVSLVRKLSKHLPTSSHMGSAAQLQGNKQNSVFCYNCALNEYSETHVSLLTFINKEMVRCRIAPIRKDSISSLIQAHLILSAY